MMANGFALPLERESCTFNDITHMPSGYWESIPYLKAASFPTSDTIRVELNDGRSVTMPVNAFPFLEKMEESEWLNWTLFDGGIRWNASGDVIRAEDILGDSRKYARFRDDVYFFRGMSEQSGEKVEGIRVVISKGCPFIVSGCGRPVPVSPGTFRKLLRNDDAECEGDGESLVGDGRLKELKHRLTTTVLDFISENGLGDIRSVTFTVDIFRAPDQRDGRLVESVLVARGIVEETIGRASDGAAVRTYRIRKLGQSY